MTMTPWQTLCKMQQKKNTYMTCLQGNDDLKPNFLLDQLGIVTGTLNERKHVFRFEDEFFCKEDRMPVANLANPSSSIHCMNKQQR